MKRVYYNDFGNKAIIDEVEIYPYAKAPKKEISYRLTLSSPDEDDFVYYVSIYETFEDAYKSMMEKNCGTWKEYKPKQKMYMSIENGNILTWSEMVEEGKELYDLFDDTNCMSWQDYYVECEE